MAPSADLCCLTRSLLPSRSLLLLALLSAAQPATHITLPPQTRGSERRRAGKNGAWRAAPPEAALRDHRGPRLQARRGSPAPLWPSTPASAAASLCSQRSALAPPDSHPSPAAPGRPACPVPLPAPRPPAVSSSGASAGVPLACPVLSLLFALSKHCPDHVS